jgi:hypothetical protein
MVRLFFAIFLLFLYGITTPARAQIPRTIPYAGVFTDSLGNPKPDGSYIVTFRLYPDSAGGLPTWTEIKEVSLRRGLFHTQLGDQSPLSTSLFGSRRWLGIKFGVDPELIPRVPLTSVPYSFLAQRADTAMFSFNASAGGDSWQNENGTLYYLNGKVGIGTRTPAVPLHVKGGGNATIYSQDTSRTNETFGIVGESQSTSGTGVYGVANAASGVTVGVIGQADSPEGTGVFGGTGATTGNGWGVWGYSNSTSGIGVRGLAAAPSGVTVGVHGIAMSPDGWAGYFDGDLGVTGQKLFQIDHPLDPANKYLNHYCAEGPEPVLIYRGNIVLDGNGEASVTLPAYFDAINRDVHYQLTCVGRFATVYIAEEIVNNRFKIAGGKPGVKVSWTVMGTRNDRSAQRSGLPVEVEKSPLQRGKYLQPELYDLPEEMGIHHVKKTGYESRTKRPD